MGHFKPQPTRGGPMATLTVPFCLEMLTFGHSEGSGALQKRSRRGEGLWPLSQCLFAWKCLHLATQRARGHFRNAADAGRAYGHSHSAFLLGNAYIWPLRGLGGTSETQP